MPDNTYVCTSAGSSRVVIILLADNKGDALMAAMAYLEEMFPKIAKEAPPEVAQLLGKAPIILTARLGVVE